MDGMKTHGICFDSHRFRNSASATSAGKVNKVGLAAPPGTFASHDHTVEAFPCVETRGCWPTRCSACNRQEPNHFLK